MRQGQQNRRGRGRNRKNQNPLTRSFESNGPDVKIRGTPAHIAEKYISYARDSLASGDPVLAENYLQHAEHYNRIIMSYREQVSHQANDSANGGRARSNGSGEFVESGDENSEEDVVEAGQEQPKSQQRSSRQPYDNGDGQQPRVDGEGGNRRNARGRSGRGRNERTSDQARRSSAQNGNDEQGERDQNSGGIPKDDQPDFLRRPIRRPKRDQLSANGEAGDSDTTEGVAE